ncbi:MAG: hypothetical protein ACT4NU_07660 [Chromatiales bacterium]
MSRFESKLAFPTVAALLTLSGMANPTQANDAKNYPGSYCQPELASVDTPNVNYDSTGSINSTGGVHVICPITKDNSANTNGLAGASVRVDSDGIAMVSCFLQSVSGLGVVLDTSLTASTTSATPVNLVLTGINVGAAAGHYLIHCIIPSGTSVRSYRINEPSPTD